MTTLRSTLVLVASIFCSNSGFAQTNINAPYNDTTALEIPVIDTISADSAEYGVPSAN